MYSSTEYKSWAKIKERVFDFNCPQYLDYGAVGIGMEESWKNSFLEFYHHIGPKPNDGQRYTVDRINNSLGYIYGNVRWATNAQQARNRRLMSNNTTGHCGVQIDQKTDRHGKSHWYVCATWYPSSNKKKAKYFSIKKFGLLPAFAMAIELRRVMLKQLNEAGAGYSETHGKKGLHV